MNRHDDWNHYAYTYGEGQQARVEFDVMAAVMPNDGGHSVRVVGPLAAEEAALALLVDLTGLHVGTLRYAERLEVVVQVDGSVLPEGLEAGLAEAECTVEVTKGWDYFNARVCPTPQDWRRIQDREALERLDLDGDGELRVLHRFYGDAEGLKAVSDRLSTEEFDLVESSETRLTLAHEHPIGKISAITLGLMRLCDAHGVAYDGWVLPG